MRRPAVIGASGVLLVLAACAKVDPYGDLSQDIKIDPSANAAAPCAAPMSGIADPTILTACTGTKGSKGRCTPKAMLGTFGDAFEQATCKPSQACLPEPIVKEGSKVSLKKCTAVANAEGRCFWPLAKDILASYDMVKSATKDQCEGEQVCAPCTNPLNGKPTGLCTLGEPPGPECKGDGGAGGAGGLGAGLKCPLDEPILEAANLKPADCGSGMVCIDKSLVGDHSDQLRPCASGVCAPLKSVIYGGNYVPKTCRSLAGAEGRCTNVGIPMIAAQKSLLPRADCDADELCAPCFDPRTGADTSACSQTTCDTPKEKAKPFPSCCGGGGKCVPLSAVPADSQGSLGADTCSGETPLCAPNEAAGAAKARPCALLGISKGICVSACTVTGLKGKLGELVTTSCNDGELCAPCNQLPAGSDGCGS